LGLHLGGAARLLGPTELLAPGEDLLSQPRRQGGTRTSRLFLEPALRAVLPPASLRDILRGLGADPLGSALDASFTSRRTVRHAPRGGRTAVLWGKLPKHLPSQIQSGIAEPTEFRTGHRVKVAATSRLLDLADPCAEGWRGLSIPILQLTERPLLLRTGPHEWVRRIPALWDGDATDPADP
jgi:hypothetical protein